MEAMGAGRAQAFLAAIQPQVLSGISFRLPVLLLRGMSLVRAITGYIGAGGLGLILNEKIGWRSTTAWA